jgi:hypothetical protein
VRWLIDAVAMLGGVLASAGVYVEFGAGYSMIVGGVFLVALAANAARINGETHVSDGD